MRGRGRRSRIRRGTATTARSRTRPGRRRASTARRSVQRLELAGHDPGCGLAAPDDRDDGGGVGQPVERDSKLARRDLQGQRQLLPRRHLPNGGTPATPADRGRHLRRRVREHRTAREHLVVPRRSPTTAPTVRFYVNGTQVASTAPTPARSPPRPTRSRSAATASTASTSPARSTKSASTTPPSPPAQIQTDMNHPGDADRARPTPPTAPSGLGATAFSAARSTSAGRPRPTTSASPATRSSAARAPAATTSRQIRP